MKNFFTAILMFAILIISPQVKAEDVVIDYGNSKIFTQADMDFCIKIIKNQLERSNCTLHNVRYVGDEESNSKENIKYLNELAKSHGYKKKFSKCLLFMTDYQSPPDPHDGIPSAWNYDSEYTDYMWYFGFYKVDSEWKLLSSGY